MNKTRWISLTGIVLVALWAVIGCKPSNLQARGQTQPAQEKKDTPAVVKPGPEVPKPATQVVQATPAQDLGQSPVPMAGLKESYQIRNKKFGLMLRPKDAGRAEGTPIVLYSVQPWKCLSWRMEKGEAETYRMVNYLTGKTFQAGDGNSVVQTQPEETKTGRQYWRIEPAGDGLYRIGQVGSGKVLSAMVRDGEDPWVVLSDWTGSDEQKWDLLDLPDPLTM